MKAMLVMAVGFAGANAFGAQWGSPTIDPVNPNDCLILVEDQALLPGRIWIEGDPDGGGANPGLLRSDVCAKNQIVAGGRGTTNIPEAGFQQDVAAIAPNIKIDRHADVVEVVYDGTGGSLDVGSSGTITPPAFINDQLDPANIPSVPSVGTVVSDPTKNQTVPDNGTLDLVPGTYGAISIGRLGVLNLVASGTYVIQNLSSNTKCVINPLAEDIILVARDFIEIDEYCRVNEAAVPGFQLLVGGADGSYGSANKNRDGVYGVPAAFGYDGDGVFNACLVLVPNGTINMRGILGTAGKPGAARFQGKSFQQVTGLNIFLSNPQELCGIDPQCGCPNSIACDSTTGVVTVTGLNLVEGLSVATLSVWSVDANIGVLSPSGNAGADQPADMLDFTSPTEFSTVNNLAKLIRESANGGEGKYLLGIIGPPTLGGVTHGYCVHTGQQLEITANGCNIVEP
jgi:hypothetical protein